MTKNRVLHEVPSFLKSGHIYIHSGLCNLEFMEGNLKILRVISKWHSPCDTTPGNPRPRHQSIMTVRHVHVLVCRFPFPNELDRLIRYDKWVSREAFRENLESILFVSELHNDVMYAHFYQDVHNTVQRISSFGKEVYGRKMASLP